MQKYRSFKTVKLTDDYVIVAFIKETSEFINGFIYTALEQAGIPFQCFPLLQTNKVLDIEEASEAIRQVLDQVASVSGIILGLLLLLKFLKNMK